MISGSFEEFRKPKGKCNKIDFVNSISIIEHLLSPYCTIENFMSRYFRKKPCVFRGEESRVEKLKSLLFDLNIQDMLDNSASEQVHVWLRKNIPDSSDSPDILESITVEDAGMAFKLYNAGHSLYCRAPVELESIVIPKALSELGVGVCPTSSDRYSRGEIETFYSRAGHTTDFHTGTHLSIQQLVTITLIGLCSNLCSQTSKRTSPYS